MYIYTIPYQYSPVRVDFPLKQIKTNNFNTRRKTRQWEKNRKTIKY